MNGRRVPRGQQEAGSHDVGEELAGLIAAASAEPDRGSDVRGEVCAQPRLHPLGPANTHPPRRRLHRHITFDAVDLSEFCGGLISRMSNFYDLFHVTRLRRGCQISYTPARRGDQRSRELLR